jgi:hypothetical protein
MTFAKLYPTGNDGEKVMLLNNKKLTNYLEKGGTTPSKKDIVLIEGQAKEDGGLFIDKINITDTKVYMKISELK